MSKYILSPLFGSGFDMDQSRAIRAAMAGADECAAEGIAARSSSPVLALCRKLIEAGHDPTRPLHAYRGDVLALKVHSIGDGARLEINSKGTDFKWATAVRRASPMRQNPVPLAA